MQVLQPPSLDPPNQPELLSVDTAIDDVSSAESEGEGEGIDDYEEHTYSYVGISIGKEQTRLASPKTPAAEKHAILFDKEFIHEEAFATGEQPTSLDPPQLKEDGEHEAFPPIVRLGQSQSTGLDGALNSLRNFAFGRPRASTTSTAEESHRKIGPFNFPSLPKLSNNSRVSLPNVDAALAWLRSSDSGQATPERTRRNSTESVHFANTPNQRPSLPRTSSDTSLALQRALSRASSLGDDTRWAGVQGQVNSRMKAIKDTLADSSLRLPNFRASISSIGRSASPNAHRQSTAPVTRSGILSEQNLAELLNARQTANKKDHRRSSPSFSGSAMKPGPQAHPLFTKAIENLVGDVVILGGYRGSILRSAEPPYKRLWLPMKVGLNIRKANLEVGLTHEDEEIAQSHIIPGGVLSHIGPVDICKRLLKNLRASPHAKTGELRVWEFGYDWRLSPSVLSEKLAGFLSRLPCNSKRSSRKGALVIAHSLGGLMTRHVVNTRPELVSMNCSQGSQPLTRA